VDNIERKLLLFIPISALIISYLVLPNIGNPFLVLNYLTLSIIISFFPLFGYKLWKNRKIKEVYDDIRQFFQDLSYYLSLGYSLKKAIEVIANNNVYSKNEFNERIKTLKRKLEKGYNTKQAFIEFLESLNNPIINSFIPLIEHVIDNSEKIDILFKNISEEMEKEIKRSRKRSEKTYYTLLSTYTSFLLFLLLVVLLVDKVINFQLSGFNKLVAVYISLLTFLVYEEAILSGFVIGQLTSNEFIEGIVHSFVFIGITFFVFMLTVI